VKSCAACHVVGKHRPTCPKLQVASISSETIRSYVKQKLEGYAERQAKREAARKHPANSPGQLPLF